MTLTSQHFVLRRRQMKRRRRMSRRYATHLRIAFVELQPYAAASDAMRALPLFRAIKTLPRLRHAAAALRRFSLHDWPQFIFSFRCITVSFAFSRVTPASFAALMPLLFSPGEASVRQIATRCRWLLRR